MSEWIWLPVMHGRALREVETWTLEECAIYMLLWLEMN